MRDSPPIEIPFNRSSLLGRELDYIASAMNVGQIAGGDQQFTRKCQAMLEQLLGAKKALITSSCTHALEMSALLLDIQPGDEVIVPAFTFVSTVNAFVLRGAMPVFCDVRADTLNLDETKLEALIRRARGRSCRCIMPGSDVRWIWFATSRSGGASSSSKTTRTACSDDITASTWAPLVSSRRRAFTKPRTSPAAKAARC
jgi:hypothetical protein